MARDGDNTCLCGKAPLSGRPAFQVKLVALVPRCFRWNQGWPKPQAPTSKLQRISKPQVSNRFCARLPVARRKASQWAGAGTDGSLRFGASLKLGGWSWVLGAWCFPANRTIQTIRCPVSPVPPKTGENPRFIHKLLVFNALFETVRPLLEPARPLFNPACPLFGMAQALFDPPTQLLEAAEALFDPANALLHLAGPLLDAVRSLFAAATRMFEPATAWFDTGSVLLEPAKGFPGFGEASRQTGSLFCGCGSSLGCRRKQIQAFPIPPHFRAGLRSGADLVMILPMQVTFRLRFHTQPGQSLWLAGAHPLPEHPVPLRYVDPEFWEVTIPLTAPVLGASLNYSYVLHQAGGARATDWGRSRALVPASYGGAELLVIDSWNHPGL